MNVIKFMNRLLCLEQVSLKYMQIALSIAVPLRRQPGILHSLKLAAVHRGWGGGVCGGSSNRL